MTECEEDLSRFHQRGKPWREDVGCHEGNMVRSIPNPGLSHYSRVIYQPTSVGAEWERIVLRLLILGRPYRTRRAVPVGK